MSEPGTLWRKRTGDFFGQTLNFQIRQILLILLLLVNENKTLYMSPDSFRFQSLCNAVCGNCEPKLHDTRQKLRKYNRKSAELSYFYTNANKVFEILSWKIIASQQQIALLMMLFKYRLINCYRNNFI